MFQYLLLMITLLIFLFEFMSVCVDKLLDISSIIFAE